MSEISRLTALNKVMKHIKPRELFFTYEIRNLLLKETKKELKIKGEKMSSKSTKRSITESLRKTKNKIVNP